MSQTRDTIVGEIRALRKKAELNRHCHSKIGEERAQRAWRVSTFVVVGSAFSAMTMLANWGDITKAVEAPSWSAPLLGGLAVALSAAVFVAEMLSRHLRWAEDSRKHQLAVEVWGHWIRTAKEFENVQSALIDEAGCAGQSSELQDQYRAAMRGTPDIPDSRFLDLKAEFREKLWVSHELDRDTGETVKQIRERFRTQTPEGGQGS